MENKSIFILILFISLLVGIVIGMNRMDYSITENFPQSSPMNVMYTDANGNISVTNDVGLQSLTISNDGALLLGNKFRFNGGKDSVADDDWLRMMNKDNTGYYGGLATGQLYSSGDTKLDGKLIISGYKDDINTIIKDLNTKIDVLSSTLSSKIDAISTTLLTNIDNVSTSEITARKDISNIERAINDGLSLPVAGYLDS